MLGAQDDAAFDLGFGHAGHDGGKIEDEFRSRVGDDRQIGVMALRGGFVEFEVYAFFTVFRHFCQRVVFDTRHKNSR